MELVTEIGPVTPTLPRFEHLQIGIELYLENCPIFSVFSQFVGGATDVKVKQFDINLTSTTPFFR